MTGIHPDALVEETSLNGAHTMWRKLAAKELRHVEVNSSYQASPI